MNDRRAMREADDVEPESAGSYELEGFAGTWVSSERATRGVARLDLAVRGGELFARVFGAGRDALIDAGERPASALFAGGVSSRRAAGFVVTYDLDALHSHVQVNLKLGVAVLGVHQSFSDGRRNGFFREFMALGEATGARVTALEDLLCLADDTFGTWQSDGPIDAGVLAGRWRNTNAASRGLLEIVVEPEGRQVLLEVSAAGPGGRIEWGRARGDLFICHEEDAMPSAAALVRYDFGFMTAELQVRQNKGILAVTSFNRFLDSSGRSDYVTRELFYREAPQ